MPESHNLALARLSSVEATASNVPCDKASGTSGHAVMFGSALKNFARIAWPAPPELRIFIPAISAKFWIGLDVL